MRPSPRIGLVASFVPKGIRFCEVGADHGYISALVLENDPKAYAYLSENKEGPYKNSLRTIEELGLEDRAKAVFSDGLKDVPNGLDCLILSGMGGILIADILSKGKDKLGSVSSLVLEPQGGREELLAALPGLGFKHVSYGIVEEKGHFYECFYLEKGEEMPLGPLEGRYGPKWRQGGFTFMKREKTRLEALEGLLGRLPDGPSRSKTLEEIALIKEVLKDEDSHVA